MSLMYQAGQVLNAMSEAQANLIVEVSERLVGSSKLSKELVLEVAQALLGDNVSSGIEAYLDDFKFKGGEFAEPRDLLKVSELKNLLFNPVE